MVLIPGVGFGWDVFETFMAARESEYTMYAVTLAGCGGTDPLPMPAPGTSYADQTWTNAALSAIVQRIEDNGLTDIVVVGHWIVGTQLAARLALEHPDIVSAVIFIGGTATWLSSDTVQFPIHGDLAMRKRIVDEYSAPQWYKTVTRETWDDNNFLPSDYARNPVRALQLWRMAAQPTVATWVRYLCEFAAQDLYYQLASSTVPALVIKPGFDDDCFYIDPSAGHYMRSYCDWSWSGVQNLDAPVTFTTIAGSRLFIMDDQPEELDRTIRTFLDSL
jgi:pimeloyl-ACP methyl ester carboxylesterase